MSKPFSILICALGGEGGGVLTDWLVNTAKLAGVPVQATSIPGVAQRTGATTYYLEMMTSGTNESGGQLPIFGLSPLPGQIDLLISSELLETGRQIGNAMSNPKQTCVISSSNRALTTMEKMGLGDSRVPDETLIDLIKQFSLRHHILDMGEIAKQSGTIISSVMLGCLGASGLLPFRKEHFEKAIQGTNKELSSSQTASLKGFHSGWSTIEQQIKNTQFIEKVIKSIDSTNNDDVSMNAYGRLNLKIPAKTFELFPPEVQHILNLGYARLVDYQDYNYANLYLERVLSVWNTEQEAHKSQRAELHTLQQNITPWAATLEAARWTALWMAFDDIVRVAELKNKRNRFAQIRKDTKAKSHDIVQVYDHFKPGIAELAGLLPEFLATPLTQWERKRVRSGLPGLELKIKLHSSSVAGALVLQFLSRLKWLRKLGTRYGFEQKGIDAWLDCVRESIRSDITLGQEVAACGRLIKGYGSTNIRAHENLSYILKSLTENSSMRSDLPKSEIVRQARINALKEESGKSLDVFLNGLGAPARPAKEQPIRWMRRPAKA